MTTKKPIFKAQLLAEKTWPQIEKYLQTEKRIIFPVGSTEQHGPNGLIGIDYLSSEAIAHKASEETGVLVAPTLPFGMALHHMAFPGTMTLTPVTYIQAVTECLESLYQHGFRKVLVINGHGGNIAPLTSAFSQALQKTSGTSYKLVNWWTGPEVTSLEKELFGDKNGFHATCGEISVTRYTHPEAYEKVNFDPLPETVAKSAWPLSPMDFRKTFADGRMNSSPHLSSREAGEKIFVRAVEALKKSLQSFQDEMF